MWLLLDCTCKVCQFFGDLNHFAFVFYNLNCECPRRACGTFASRLCRGSSGFYWLLYRLLLRDVAAVINQAWPELVSNLYVRIACYQDVYAQPARLWSVSCIATGEAYHCPGHSFSAYGIAGSRLANRGWQQWRCWTCADQPTRRRTKAGTRHFRPITTVASRWNNRAEVCSVSKQTGRIL